MKKIIMAASIIFVCGSVASASLSERVREFRAAPAKNIPALRLEVQEFAAALEQEYRQKQQALCKERYQGILAEVEAITLNKIDTPASAKKLRDSLEKLFEACYPYVEKNVNRDVAGLIYDLKRLIRAFDE